MKRMNHKVICLIGSTRARWQNQYRNVNRELALAGYVVFSVSIFKTDVADIEKHRDLLESIHFQKIDMSDAVVLIYKDAVGKHTAMEIEYCKKARIPVITFKNITQTRKEIEKRTK